MSFFYPQVKINTGILWHETPLYFGKDIP